MLARFEPQPERLRRCLAGPLGPHLESFATLLSRQGYSRLSDGGKFGWQSS